MNPTRDDAIESLLRGHFDGPVADAGFSDRVMQQIPRRRHRVGAWSLWVGVLVGAGASWLALAPSRLLHAACQDWLAHDWSVPAVTVAAIMLGMILLALVWGVTEADNH